MNDKKRNFCIIAHIDHGKSTLADRLLELTETVTEREMKDQLLDTMELERERGITIKLQPVRMMWNDYELNLIDTPGHIDFNYEVSRSLKAVEGAILLVDATQGIQAQTLTNLYLAQKQNLKIIPVINKIDMPASDVDSATKELTTLLNCSEEDIIPISAKKGTNIDKLLSKIVSDIPPPPTNSDDLRGLIFDAQYDEFRGVVIYTRIFSGNIKKGDKIKLVKGKEFAEVLEVGFFSPNMKSSISIESGSIGYIITNIKNIESTKVGDTIIHENSTLNALEGYQEIVPMVYAGVYPEDGSDYSKLRKAIEKLKLSDSSLVYEPDRSEILGFGFRCGFLGLLHIDIFQERLIREYEISLILTTPTVAYKTMLTSGKEQIITSPSQLPEQSLIQKVEQPIASLHIITPKQYMGPLMNYIQDRKGIFTRTEFMDERRVLIQCTLPLSKVIVDFYDSIKNISSGYASYNYELSGYKECKILKMEILVAEESVPGLSMLVDADEAESIGRSILLKLKDILPKEQFVIKLQATIGGKIIASERISAMRKDVTAKLYGGDVTRKRKLLEKQKKGKKKMMNRGSVNIPSKAYLAVLKRD